MLLVLLSNSGDSDNWRVICTEQSSEGQSELISVVGEEPCDAAG